MKQKHSWWIALVVVALLVAACGPEMATPTPGGKAAATPTSGGKAANPTATVAQVQATTPAQVQPVAADDWRVQGSPTAPVTIIEYSDFQ